MIMAMLKHTIAANIFLQIIRISLSKVTVSVELVSYSNPDGVLKDGTKCDGWTQRGCDHRFTICLDEYNGNKEDYGTCLHGSKTTHVFSNSYNVMFNSQHSTSLDLEENETGLLLKVAVFDDDFNPDDFIETLFNQITLGSVGIPAKNRTSANYITQEIIGNEKTKLTFKYSIYCAQHYFRVSGTCGKYCEERDSIDGHYRCNDNGKRICLLGWIDESTNCTTEFGMCRPKLCMNGGTCEGNRSCTCTEGYQGSTCSVDIDECSAGSTENGVCDSENTLNCVNSVGSYTCVCKSGFSGEKCQRNGTDGSTSTKSKNSKTGLIAGLTVMFIIIILIVLFATILLIRKRMKSRSKEENHTTSLETLRQQREHADPTNEVHDNPYILDSSPKYEDFADTGVVVPPDETDQTLYQDATSTVPTFSRPRDVPASAASLYIEENPNYEGVSHP